MPESGRTESFLRQLSSAACFSSQSLETAFVPSPLGLAVSSWAKGQVGVSSTLSALLSQPPGPRALPRTHLPGWLTFPADLLMRQINQSHSLICRPLLPHLLARKHCRGSWESWHFVMQAPGKKGPVYQSLDHSGKKVS